MRISIAMATYNGERFLREQLDSLAAQTVLPDELQVGDDGSTDGTLQILADFAAVAPFPVHIHRNSQRLGFGENFIQTARRCRGYWIAFCDQDDVWVKDKLEWATKQIASGPSDLALLVHNATITNDDLGPIGNLYRYPAEDRTKALDLPPEWFSIGVTQIFRGEIITAIPSNRRVSFPWHAHRNAHDVWVSLIANCVGTVLRSDRPLVLYRRHETSVTDQGRSNERTSWLSFQGPSYLQRASYLQDVSKLLAGLAGQTDRRFERPLAEASQAIREHAVLLGYRGDARTAASFQHRMNALRRAISAGGYSSEQRWSFGKSRLIKDLAGVILSPATKSNSGP